MRTELLLEPSHAFEPVDALLVRKDGQWTLGLMAAGEEDSPPAGEQYKAKYPDAPPALVN